MVTDRRFTVCYYLFPRLEFKNLKNLVLIPFRLAPEEQPLSRRDLEIQAFRVADGSERSGLEVRQGLLQHLGDLGGLSRVAMRFLT